MAVVGEGCTCVYSDVKYHIEGALVLYIRKIEKQVAYFKEQAEEFKVRDPKLAERYINIARSQKNYQEKVEKFRQDFNQMPDCKES